MGCVAFGCLLSGLPGCYSPKPDFASADPTSRLLAIRGAAQSDDQGAIPDLIRMLGSDDAAARLLAIRTLQRLTGEDRGFDHASSARSRQEAIERWLAWYNDTKDAEMASVTTGMGG